MPNQRQLRMSSMLNLENRKLAFKYLQELKLIPWTYDGRTYAGSGEQEVD